MSGKDDHILKGYRTAAGLAPAGGKRVMPKFQPFYAVAENYPYKMYFDRNVPVAALW
jgi:hypothetical protein